MRLSLNIDGMSCGHCVARVRQTLERLPGVRVEAVDIGLATLSYDPDRTTPHLITQAVANAGYEARAAA